MSSTSFRVAMITGLAAGVAYGLSGAASHARALDRFGFRVTLATGKVAAQDPPSGAYVEAPWSGSRAHVVDRDGKLQVWERRFGETNTMRLEISAGLGGGSVAWQLQQGRHLVFVWRVVADRDAGRGVRDYHDRIACLDIDSGQILWSRESADLVHYRPEPLGDGMVLLPHSWTLEIVRTTTGETLRSQPRPSHAYAVRAMQGGAALLSDAVTLEAIDTGTLRTLWKLPLAGAVGPMVPVNQSGTCGGAAAWPEPPLPRDVDWLVYGKGVLVRLDPQTGRPRYQVKSRCWSDPCLFAGQVYEPEIRIGRDTSEVSVVARRLADGAVLRRYPVQRYHRGDRTRARVTRATPQLIEVATEWMVLD